MTNDNGITQKIPCTYALEGGEDAHAKALEAQRLQREEKEKRDSSNYHYHLGSPNPNEFTLLKFYSFNTHVLGCLFGVRGKAETSLPFKMTSKEYEVARLNSARPCSILLMGRSGTGKTSVLCYRLASDWNIYWMQTTDFEDPALHAYPPKMKQSS